MKRLWLAHYEQYRVRFLDGSVMLCRWDDAACAFRGKHDRLVDMLTIGAVAPMAGERQGRPRWFAYADCYRERHRPVRGAWVHPYARRAA